MEQKGFDEEEKKIGWVGKVEHLITEDLESQTDKFGLKYE